MILTLSTDSENVSKISVELACKDLVLGHCTPLISISNDVKYPLDFQVTLWYRYMQARDVNSLKRFTFRGISTINCGLHIQFLEELEF